VVWSSTSLLAGLSMPLPKGVVRTYSKLKEQNILLGESSLNHTPKDTPIRLKIGKNFDVKVTQTLAKRSDTKNWFNVDVKYSLKNSSDEPKTVTLLVPFNKQSDSKINTKEKYSFTKGNFVTFSIKVPANKTQSFKVNYESKK